MRNVLFALVAVSLAAPASAAPNCSSLPECLARAGLGGRLLDEHSYAVLGALASPVVVLGAFVTAAVHAHEVKPPVGVVVTPDEHRRPRASLALVPSTFEPAPPLDAKQPKPHNDGAFKFNDKATNVALAVGGAAVLGGIIAGIVGGAKHR